MHQPHVSIADGIGGVRRLPLECVLAHHVVEDLPVHVASVHDWGVVAGSAGVSRRDVVEAHVSKELHIRAVYACPEVGSIGHDGLCACCEASLCHLHRWVL